jgi:hypothetical protein
VEAKARYRAVKIQPQCVVTPGKQTNKPVSIVHGKKVTMFRIRSKGSITVIASRIETAVGKGTLV